MENNLDLYVCQIQTDKLPLALNCIKFNNMEAAKIYSENTQNTTTIIPLCKYIPGFINAYRAKVKAINTFINY